MASSTIIRTVDPVTHRGRVINTNTLLSQYNQALIGAQNATTLAFQMQGWRPPLNDTALDRETT